MLSKKISEIIDNNVKIISKQLEFKKDFFGDAPAPFIGRFGYPFVNVGVLSAIEYPKKEELDNPKQWVEEHKGVNEIVDIRSSLINSRFKSNVKSKIDKLTALTQEIGLASKPVEVEVNLKDRPVFRINVDSHNSPYGPNADMEKAKITSNPKIESSVEKVFTQTDLKAVDAVNYLYKKGINENQLSKILSVGAVGLKINRKLVPTRWSITATDDMLGKQLVNEVKLYPQLDHYELYFGGILGNYYLAMLLPQAWSYELFEMAVSNKESYSTDYEFYYGRKTYSEACEGGYYTVRLAVAEQLRKMRKQASAVVFRFITSEYTAPLGVWVTREASRNSMSSRALAFNSQEEMINAGKQLIMEKFSFDLNNLIDNGVIFREKKQQKRLFEF